MTDDKPPTDFSQIRTLVRKAVTAAVPADAMVQRKSRPDSLYSWPVPDPLAGLHAALAVAQIAQEQAHEFAKELRGEGTTWLAIADLLQIPWSEEYSRRERAFELVAGQRERFDDLRVYWRCGGPDGCGELISDRGPYNGPAIDNEHGHADTCVRVAAETEAWRREMEESEVRDQRMDEAMALVTDPFGQETVRRARYVQAHGGRYLGWSTSESLAVGLVLDDAEALRDHGYPKPEDALDRVLSGGRRPPVDPVVWLRNLRVAATGITPPGWEAPSS